MSYLQYRSPKAIFQELLQQAGEPFGRGQKANNVIYLDKVIEPDTTKRKIIDSLIAAEKMTAEECSRLLDS